jgi:hypothetical protein
VTSCLPPPPQRGDFHSEEAFDEARSRWRSTVGRNRGLAQLSRAKPVPAAPVGTGPSAVDVNTAVDRLLLAALAGHQGAAAALGSLLNHPDPRAWLGMGMWHRVFEVAGHRTLCAQAEAMEAQVAAELDFEPVPPGIASKTYNQLLDQGVVHLGGLAQLAAAETDRSLFGGESQAELTNRTVPGIDANE